MKIITFCTQIENVRYSFAGTASHRFSTGSICIPILPLTALNLDFFDVRKIMLQRFFKS